MRMLFGVGVSLVLLACSQTAFATFSPKFLETLGLEPFEADQSVEEELLPGLTISAVRSDRGDVSIVQIRQRNNVHEVENIIFSVSLLALYLKQPFFIYYSFQNTHAFVVQCLQSHLVK